MQPMSSEPLSVVFAPGGEGQGVLRLKGPLTAENVSPFMNAVRGEQSSTIILDLSQVPYVDSAGLGSLVSAFVTHQKAGRRFVLTGVNNRVLQLLQITRVEPLFLMFPTVWDAIDALDSAAQA